MRRLVLCTLIIVLAGCSTPPIDTNEPLPTDGLSISERTRTPMPSIEASASTPTTLPTLTPLPPFERSASITPPPLNAAAFSPDGTRLAYVTTVGLTMLDTADYSVLWEVALPGVESRGLAWTSDGKHLVTLRAMERDGGQHSFGDTVKASVLTLDASDGAVISDVPSDAVRSAFSLAQGITGEGYSEYTYPVALSPDGSRYAVARGDLTLGVTASADEQIIPFDPPFGQHPGFTGIAFSADGGLLAASGQTNDGMGIVQIRALDTMTMLAQFDVSGPGSLAFSPDAAHLAVLSGQTRDGHATGLHVFDLASGEQQWAQFADFEGITWSEHGIYTVTDGKLHRYHADTGNRYVEEVLVFPSSTRSPTEFEATPYGVIRVTPEFLHLIDSENMSSRIVSSGFYPMADFGLDSHSWGEVATYSPDGSAMALRSHSYLWVRFSDNTYYKSIAGTGPVAWSPESDRLAVRQSEREIGIWGIRGPLLTQLESPIPVQALMWLPGEVLVVAGNIGSFGEPVGGWQADETALAAIDIATGDVLWERGGFAQVRRVSASSEGERILVEITDRGAAKSKSLLLDAATGDTIADMLLAQSPNGPPALSPDGTRIFVKDNLGRMFDEHFQLLEETASPNADAIRWTPDSALLMVMSSQGFYALWDRELQEVCRTNTRIDPDYGLARAISPALNEVLFETQQHTLDVWLLRDARECE